MSATAFRAAVITVSDRVHKGVYEDKSGPAAVAGLMGLGFAIAGTVVVPDEAERISAALLEWSARVDLIVTTGGTGCAPRDVTPEATMQVIERQFRALSRRCGSRGANLSRARGSRAELPVCAALV